MIKKLGGMLDVRSIALQSFSESRGGNFNRRQYHVRIFASHTLPIESDLVMSRIRALIIVVFCFLVSTWAPSSWVVAKQFDLVPSAKSVEFNRQVSGFEIPETLTVSVPAKPVLIQRHVDVLAKVLKSLRGIEVVFATDQESANVVIQQNDDMPAESYQLEITDDQISITASNIKGVCHATATLLQLFGQFEKTVPGMKIVDQPDCSYRNLMIDLGRNPHSIELLKETVDLLWFFKIDSLHLHLTDDQRFAFPSRAFPKLVTERGRISWDEFAELEVYAQERGVTLIPELEVPGHSTLLRRAYPDIFGKTPTELATSKTSREGIKKLLDEMIELFPSSPYVHIGGDEAYGVPVKLQRELINDLHAYLKSKGKKTIVWEGPGQGTGDNRVHPEVIHINWRTIDFPADQMLAAGHPVVNATWDPLYVVDHYPRNNFTMASPEYIFKTLDLQRFAHFNPGIKTFQKPIRVEPNKLLIGFCMPWWEGREVNYFPLIVPRAISLAEIAWRSSSSRDYADFNRRTRTAESIRMRCFYPVSILAEPIFLDRESVFHNQTTIRLANRNGGAGRSIRYTLDGSKPGSDSELYDGPIELKKTTTVRAAVFFDEKQLDHGSRRTFVHVSPVKNLAFGKPVVSSATSGPLFSTRRLTDGGTGILDYYLGYPAEPEPIQITVDLGGIESLNRIVIHAFSTNNAYESYLVQISDDGKNFKTVADRTRKPETMTSETIHDFDVTNARFIRISTNGCKGYVFDSFSKLTEIQAFLVDKK